MDVRPIDRDPARIVYLRHVGPCGWPLGAIGAAWTALSRERLPASGLRLDARPTFECYPADVETRPDGRFDCEITIPVAPT